MATELELRGVADPSGRSATTEPLLDAIDVAVAAVDEHGVLTRWNAAAARLFDCSAAEVIGQALEDVIPIEDGAGGLDALLRRARLEGHCRGSLAIERRDGRRIDIEARIGTVAAAAGRLPGLMLTLIDVTEVGRPCRRQHGPRSHLRAAGGRETARPDGPSWDSRLGSAFCPSRYVVHAQPVVDLAGRGVMHHELLIRKRADDGSLILPGRFLPAAERCSLILDIDGWMIDRAVELAAADFSVAVNLSAQSVIREKTREHLRAALARRDVDPSRIMVEITETALLSDERAAQRFVLEARALGCRVALDDFGSGYAGFRYLKKLPVDYLKIDREFVSDLAYSSASEHVVKAVVSLARAFGQQTIAEGIEDEETFTRLRELDVDCGQGYLLARPAPVADCVGTATVAPRAAIGGR